jgi:hypothetical protein
VGSPPAVADSYTLQEDENADFSSPSEHQTTGTSMDFTGKTGGTYYYRVRANNVYGFGQWSNVVSTRVETGFFDDFSDVSTGWPHDVTYNRGTDPDGPVMKTKYTDGTYRIKILLDRLGLNNKRMGVIPSPWVNPHSDYDVQVDHYFTRALDQEVDPTWGKAGLIFGANSSFSTIYTVEWHFPLGSNTPQCAVYRYSNFTLPTTIVWLAGGTPLRDWSSCSGLKSGYDKTNQIRVEVRGAHATVYINSINLGTFSDPGLASMHRVGLQTGSYERTPVESRFDNFRVTEK